MVELKTERVPVMFEPSLLQQIDDYRFDNRISSRAKALRRLVEVGLMEIKQTKKGEVTA